MKIFAPLIVLLCILNSTLAQPIDKPVTKKGFGLAERRGMGLAQLTALKLGWYYNWGSQTKLKSDTQFVPMIFSLKHINDPIEATVVLGYNEPDNEKQSNISVTDARAKWPQVAKKASRVGSPAMAGNPLTKPWLKEFLTADTKVDFITVHWYKGADAKHFIRDMEEIHAAFGKPIWVTEYAPQTAGSSENEPHKYSQSQVDTFIITTSRWMEDTPWMERYAWHDSRVGTSAIFDLQGDLTATGKSYANQSK